MQIRVKFGTDIVRERVWVLHLVPSIGVVRYAKYHQQHSGEWLLVIISFLFWHVEVQINKKHACIWK